MKNENVHMQALNRKLDVVYASLSFSMASESALAMQHSSGPSVCLCPQSVLWQNGWLDLDAIWGDEWGRAWYEWTFRHFCPAADSITDYLVGLRGKDMAIFIEHSMCCPSVRHTPVLYQMINVKRRITQRTPHDSSGNIVFWCQCTIEIANLNASLWR